MRNAHRAEVTLAPWVLKLVTNVWEQTSIKTMCTGHREEYAGLEAMTRNQEEQTGAENPVLEFLCMF